MTDPVTMFHPALPGEEAVIVDRATYRSVWYQRGWRSNDDPGYTGGPTDTPAGSPTGFAPNLRTAIPADWPEVVLSTQDAVCPTTALTFEHGQLVARGSGAGTGARSNRRSAFMIPGSPGGYSRVRSRWSGRTHPSAVVPQRGHLHGVGIQPDGTRRAVVVWHDIVFSLPQQFNLAIWESNPADLPAGFAVVNGSPADGAAVTAGVRASNVVTLTVGADHGYVAGDVVQVFGMTDTTYNGTFQITSVTATTIVYGQTAADDPSAGTGTVILARETAAKDGLVRSIAVTDAVRANGAVTATVPAGHPFQLGDWLNVDLTDATYDGQFCVSAVTATTVVWRQAVADDASSGAGTINKVLPYWVESEWLPGLIRARVWPDVGVGGGTGGPFPAGPPPWESAWSMATDLTPTGADQPDPGFGRGCGVLAAHLASGSTITEVRYDSIEATALATT